VLSLDVTGTLLTSEPINVLPGNPPFAMMISGFPSPFMSATFKASKLIETSVLGNEADTIFVKNVVGAGAGVGLDVSEELEVGICMIVVSEDEEPPPHPLSASAETAIIKIDLFIYVTVIR
jgi:hypothetical protein